MRQTIIIIWRRKKKRDGHGPKLSTRTIKKTIFFQTSSLAKGKKDFLFIFFFVAVGPPIKKKTNVNYFSWMCACVRLHIPPTRKTWNSSQFCTPENCFDNKIIEKKCITRWMATLHLGRGKFGKKKSIFVVYFCW